MKKTKALMLKAAEVAGRKQKNTDLVALIERWE